MKDKLVPILVVLVIVAAFAVGMLYGKVRVYEDKLAGLGGAVAGEQNVPEGQAQAPEAPPPDLPLADADWDRIQVGAAAEKGEGGAKVVVVEFSDYQCPFCARYSEDTYSKILSDYVDTGKVKYMFRDLPLQFHPNAKPAAIAARCAGDQGMYWEMHDALFANQEEWSSGDPQKAYEGYAVAIGLSAGEFSSCFESGKYDEVVDEDLALAQEVGATGTPTFFINGVKLVGAQPYSAFQAVIDEELGE